MPRFVLSRILGNDLPPRHVAGQTLANLEFVLAHEPPAEGRERRWVVNRIVAPEVERAILGRLAAAGERVLRLPFVAAEYDACAFDFEGMPEAHHLHGERHAALDRVGRDRVVEWCNRARSRYVFNVNGARNAALADARDEADWVLPFDGNCFFTAAGWSAFAAAAAGAGDAPYVVVPMARILDNARLLETGFAPKAAEEPQIAFRRDAPELFDPERRYGAMPKACLLARLGVPGPWHGWLGDLPWAREPRGRSAAHGRFVVGGWVARLFSGNAPAEATGSVRFGQRWASIRRALEPLDAAAMRRRAPADGLNWFRGSAFERDRRAAATGDDAVDALVRHALDAARAALDALDAPVVGKTVRAASGDPADFRTLAPLWWPDPERPDGLPFVRRDGVRRDPAVAYAEDGGVSDALRLTALCERVAALSLAWRFTGERVFAERAAAALRVWFVDPATRMNPNLRFAQIRRGHGEDGSPAGIVEGLVLHFLFDPIRWIERSGTLAETERAAIRRWFAEYLRWLVESPQGMAAWRARNNIGTCVVVQGAAILAFLGRPAGLRRWFDAATMRIAQQILPDGRQPEELARAQPAHYTLFNLQIWAATARLAGAFGVDLWAFRTRDGRGLAPALERAIAIAGEADADPAHRVRLGVLRAFAPSGLGGLSLRGERFAMPPVLPPGSAVAPWWQLGMADDGV